MKPYFFCCEYNGSPVTMKRLCAWEELSLEENAAGLMHLLPLAGQAADIYSVAYNCALLCAAIHGDNGPRFTDPAEVARMWSLHDIAGLATLYFENAGVVARATGSDGGDRLDS